MASNNSKILILEDDESIASALSEAFQRAGHIVFSSNRPQEAKDLFAKNPGIEFVFCDCLLPQMTGVDFVKQIRAAQKGAAFKVVLMSGIYTDKQFIQEATQATQAVAFLKKPFEIEQVLKIVKKEDTPHQEDTSTRKILYQMFANTNVSSRQKRKVIESIEEISGFDLPFLYSLLVETKSNGYLNIYNSDGSVSGISFSNGNIVGVDVDDTTTFLGEMLIQSGYSTPEDVQAALRDKSNRRIGNYLIHNNQLSPHAFDLILLEQMNIRLVKTMVDKKIRVNFSATEVEMSNPSIDADTLTLFLHDWIASKLSLSWLKSLYTMWSGNMILKSPSYREDHPALEMSLVRSLDNFTDILNNKMTLSQLLDVKGYSEVAVYKAIHFLLTKGLVVFAQRVAFANPQEQLKALKKVWAELDNKTSFEVVTYLETLSAGGKIESTVDEFMSILGDCPASSEKEVFALWNKIKQTVDGAVLDRQDRNKSDKLRQDYEKTDAEEKLRASSLLEDAKKSLHMSQYVKALECLESCEELNPQIQQLHLLKAWAKLGAVDMSKKAATIKEVELETMQVPPDERYDYLFPFVMGLLNKLKGDVPAARKSFEKSIALDSSFIPARRELSILQAQNKKQDVFSMDLKQVVSGLFRKRQ